MISTTMDVRVNMDDDDTAEFIGLNDSGIPQWFVRSLSIEETAARVGALRAAGYVPGLPDDDPLVPGRTGTVYTWVVTS